MNASSPVTYHVATNGRSKLRKCSLHNIYAYIYIYVFVYICIYLYIYIYAYVHVYVYVYKYIYIYIYMCIYIRKCLYIACMRSLFYLTLGNEDGGVQLVYESACCLA